MGYTKRNGQFAATADVVLIPPGTVAVANGHGPALELGDQRVLRLSRVVTEAEGISPTLDVTIETSPDGTDDSWYEAGEFSQATEPGSERKVFACDRFVRASYEIGGTDAESTGSVTKDGDGPDVTIDGASEADFHAEIEIQQGGVRGTATFRWSQDGGDSWEESDVPTAADVALGDSGITAHFAADTAGSNGEVTETGNSPAVTPSGEPVEADDIKIEIQTGGARDEMTFRWSKDGGDSWEESDVPGVPSYALGDTGVTANFAADSPGANGDVTHTGTGAPAVTASGTPTESDSIKIEITTGGARGTGVFRWSKDGGDSWEEEDVTIPSGGVYALGTTGATANFAAGTYVLGDTYEWSTTAPVVYVEGDTYEWSTTAPILYVADTTYSWTSDNPDSDAEITFGVTGESAGRRV